jgi:hypothetical protein
MNGPKGWPPLRQHGRHRTTPPVIKETSVTPSRAAALPGPAHWSGPIFAGGWAAEPEPDKVVECGFCHVSGLASQIPETAGGEHRCSDIEECVQRDIRRRENGGQPRPLMTFPATALEPLPKREPAAPVAEPEPQPVPSDEVIDAHLARFNALSDAQDEAEKAAGEPEAGEPAEPVTEDNELAAPHSQTDVTYPVADEDESFPVDPAPAPPVDTGHAPRQDAEELD